MKTNKQQSRSLAYLKAHQISDADLHTISGGQNSGTTHYTTKQTVDNRGNWDVGADVQWD